MLPRLLACICLCALWNNAPCQVSGAPPSKFKETGRFALVIGNGNYADTHLPPLTDAITDSVHVADTLKELGFKVYGGSALVNLNRLQMVDKIAGFSASLPPGALVFIYYSGHGVEIQGSNYLIPVDAKANISGQLGPPALIELSALIALKGAKNADLLEDRLAFLKPAAIIAVIDACRSSGLPGSNRGLAKPSAQPANTIIAFPTRPGATAKSPSPYATALISHLREPGLRLEDIFNSTREDVKQESGMSQLPQEFSSLPPKPIYLRSAMPPPDGTLLTSDKQRYSVVFSGQRRVIPDVPTLLALGFEAQFAIVKSDQEIRLIPEGPPFPTLDSALLRGKRCVYYLFWGMKWCIPNADDLKNMVQQNEEPKIMSSEESFGIPPGDPARIMGGVRLRFQGREGIFLLNSGSLTPLPANAPLPSGHVIGLPAFMYNLLTKRENTATPGFSYLSGSKLVVDELSRQIYVAEESIQSILVFDSSSPSMARGIKFNKGAPSLMVLAAKKRQLFVADSPAHQIHVIDVRTNTLLYSFAQHFRSPTQITGLALSPDENRLYVGNQGGESLLSLGTITVFDLSKNGPPEPVNDVGKVNCPEGMSITPDGSRIYIASQCGSGADPLFIFDTDTETVISEPGFAVGRTVALAPRQQKAYIARDGVYPGDAPKVVTVVDMTDNSVVASLPINADFFSTTPDSKYVVAAGYKFLYLIDADTDTLANIVPFDTAPRALGLGPSEDGKTWMCYVWLPDEQPKPRLFFGGMNSLLEKKK